MLIQRFLPRPTPLITLSFSKQKSITLFLHHPIHAIPIPNLNLPFFTSLSTRPFQFSSSLHSFSTTSSQSILESPKNDVFSEIDAVGIEIEEEINDVSEGLERVSKSETSDGELKGEKLLPNLSVKEKKELASYAHSLGKKLKSQQVGKSGVTDFVITALIETLEANELLKLKIHNNCPGELEDAVKQLEVGTGSVVVSKIGRTVILYRPSLSKMKAREKKQAQRIPMRKQPAPQQLQSKTEVPRQFGRGRRGSSRLGG